MSAKLKSRLDVSKGGKSNVADASVMPIELGGTGESYKELAIYWKNLAQENRAWYSATEIYKSIV